MVFYFRFPFYFHIAAAKKPLFVIRPKCIEDYLVAKRKEMSKELMFIALELIYSAAKQNGIPIKNKDGVR